jgi:hypothetical protein
MGRGRDLQRSRVLVRFSVQLGSTKNTVFILSILEQSTGWTEGSVHRESWCEWVNKNTFSTVINLEHCPAFLTDHPSRHSRDVSGPAKGAFESIEM